MAENDAAESTGLTTTPLFELHQQHGAKMVAYAGYTLPLHYSDGITREHAHTRKAASLFDVSHMGQIELRGARTANALEHLLPVDVIGLKDNRQRYALITNESGGILDDLMLTNAGDCFFLVVNASRKKEDQSYFESRLNGDCELKALDGYALLALQGPAAAGVMRDLAPGSDKLLFMHAARLKVAGADAFVTRSGYTGEDGFEISVKAEHASPVAREMLSRGEVQLAGLGARDTLRLEAGLCLYGEDIDERTTPVEAGLKWALSRVRRPGGERAGGYPGFEVIADQLERGVDRVRVGILPEGRAPVRGGTELVDNSGRKVGKITSGGYGATVEGPVAMGYVETPCGAEDSRLNALVRGKPRPVRVAKLPFVSPRYYRG